MVLVLYLGHDHGHFLSGSSFSFLLKFVFGKGLKHPDGGPSKTKVVLHLYRSARLDTINAIG